MALNNLFLLVSMIIVCLATGIHGTSHLMFASSGQVNITRDGCGVSKVCVDQEMNCNSSMVGSCLFASIRLTNTAPPNGSVLDIALQGTAEINRYVAIGLFPQKGTPLIFICGRNGTVFRFFTRDLINDTLTPSETPVKEILGNITGNLLKCQFTVPNVNATRTRSPDNTFAVSLARGALANGAPEELFNASRMTGLLNLADPPSTLPTTTMVPTTTMATTSAGPASFISPASLLLWSVLALPAMLRM